MASRDFLRKDAPTPLSACYVMAGAVCQLSTNFQPILDCAGESFLPTDRPVSSPDLRLRFWVDSQARSGPPWPKPYYRGLDHLIFAGFDSENSLLVDLRRRRAVGRFSPAMGTDGVYWKTVIFPVLLSIVAASVGVTELHCACVARKEGGLLLAGNSGSGKSTLSFALARNGFAFLSDDRTFFSRPDGRLLAWGMPTLLKLRPDAAALFSELGNLEPDIAADGERAFHIDPERQFQLQRSGHCEPRWLVFLERQPSPDVALDEMPRAEAAARLQEDLMPETPEAMKSRRETINAAVEGGCWLLRYGGEPRHVARALSEFCLSTLETKHLALKSE